MSEIIFELNNVSKKFGNTPDTLVTALNDINLRIEKGEFTSLVGPSGSGKTTLLNIMSGLEKASTGQVLLHGTDINAMTENELAIFRRDHIGFVFQAYNLIPVLTVKENIEYTMTLQGVSAEERHARVSEILSMVDLSGKQDRFPYQLSGGQQQRVAVARAIVAKPDIILADEPTANLDSKTGGDLVDLMLDLNEKFKITFIFSTHDSIIMEKAKRLVTLHDGRIVTDEVR